MRLPKNKSQKNLFPEYKQAINNVVLHQKNISIELEKSLLEKGVQQLFIDSKYFKKKQEKIKQEYLVSVKSVLKNNLNEVTQNYSNLKDQTSKDIRKKNKRTISKIINQNYKYTLGHLNERLKLEVFKILLSGYEGEWHAKVNSWYVTRLVKNAKIKDEQERLEIAMKEAITNPNRVVSEMESYSILNESSRVKVLKKAIENIDNDFICSDLVSEHIYSLGIKSDERKIEIAKLTMAWDHDSLSPNIDKYSISSHIKRLELALLASKKKESQVSKYIYNYNILDEKDRISIAKNEAKNYPDILSDNINEYRIKSSTDRFNIAKIVANNINKTFSENIKNFHIIWKDNRYELALIIAKNNLAQISRNIDKYRLRDESCDINIAKIVVKKYPIEVSKYLYNYEIEDESIRLEIFKDAIKRNFNTIKYIKNYNIGIDNFFTDDEYYTDFNDENIDRQSFMDALLIFVKKNIFHNIQIEAVKSENSRIENLIFIFQAVVWEECKIDIKLDSKNNCRNIFFQKIWLNPKLFINKKFSERSIQDFYTICIRIYKNIWKEFFESLDIENNLTDDRKLTKLHWFFRNLEELIYITKAKEKSDFNIQNIIQTLKLIQENVDISTLKKSPHNVIEWFVNLVNCWAIKTKISSENLEKIMDNLDLLYFKGFTSLFNLKNKKISREDIKKLECKWWDLEVFFTLISRFYWEETWLKEIPVFSNVVDSVLSNNFANYKYYWDCTDKSDIRRSEYQLTSLSPEEIEYWKQNPYTLKLFNSKKEVNLSDNELLKSAQWEYIEQLLRQKHLDLIDKWLSEEIWDYSITFFDPKEVILVSNKTSKEAIKELSWKSKKEKQNLYLKILLTLLKVTENKNLFEKSLKNLKWLELSKNIRTDLDSIHSKLKPIWKWEESIIFTTIFDDPKLLLQIWNLVDASSCQDYKIGGYIQSLLWYVVDANVKWVLWFAIDRKHLWWDNKKYEKLKQLIKDWNYRLDFNAPKRVLKIDDIEIELWQAVARRIVKLGNDKKVFLERPYYQNHFARDEILQNIERLVGNFVKTFNGEVVKKGITIEWTRNPWWVYSDAKWGIQYSKYYI